jgi:hypothetical protein
MMTSVPASASCIGIFRPTFSARSTAFAQTEGSFDDRVGEGEQ